MWATEVRCGDISENIRLTLQQFLRRTDNNMAAARNQNLVFVLTGRN
jgi:hypothetical protein